MSSPHKTTHHTTTATTTSSQGEHKRVEHVGDYIIQEKIGQGSFATVYKAQHKITNQVVAIKSVRRSKLTKKLLENLESEISILTAIRHDHIVGLIECQKTDTNIYLVMEFCSLGDLSHYIKDVRTNKASKGPAGGLPERVVRHYLKQLANALQFLRSQNLVHRDIKPQNLLLVQSSNEDELPTLKVADFGFARFLPGANLADTLCGSPLYMGPEILSYKKYDAKADLWSVGAVLYEMVTGRPPFRAQNHIELLKKIQENNDQIHFPDERNHDIIIGSDLKDLIRKLLKKNPVERMSFEEFFNHPAVVKQPLQQISIQRRSSSRPNSTTLQHSQPPTTSSNNSYEPPPFAQRHSSNNNQQRRYSLTKQYNTTLDEVRNKSPDDRSPLYSRGRYAAAATGGAAAAAAAVITAVSPSRMNSGTQQQQQRMHRRGGGEEEEDVLQEYVVLDRRIIETNQFADELDASPRTTTSIPMSSENMSKRNSSAVNIPISPSTPPFVRERKASSGGSSAGSALAKALSKASVRLFGTSMPSPPKDGSNTHNNSSSIGSPHGFMNSTLSTTSNRTMKHIERLACMAHAVSKYGDQKYELYNNNNNNNGEEASALYLKSLSILELGLNVAQQYWQNYLIEEDDKNLQTSLNDAVQWMRDKFNVCLKRAETIKESLVEVSVEKLLYDRALEMSRAAAVHELVGENITECERDYQTAIWMLEAILQVRPSHDGQMIEEDDRRIINKFIDSIRHRITVLRKKVELAEAQ